MSNDPDDPASPPTPPGRLRFAWKALASLAIVAIAACVIRDRHRSHVANDPATAPARVVILTDGDGREIARLEYRARTLAGVVVMGEDGQPRWGVGDDGEGRWAKVAPEGWEWREAP